MASHDAKTLAGKVALVTGANGGLGAHFARTLAAAGAGVVLASRRLEKLKALRAEFAQRASEQAARSPQGTTP